MGILAVNPETVHCEKGKRFTIIYARALKKVFRFRYCVASHELQIEQWRLPTQFVKHDIQWFVACPRSTDQSFGMVVDWEAHSVLVYHFRVISGETRCRPLEIARFGLRAMAGTLKGREHHCYCLCFLQQRLCAVVEAECFLLLRNVSESEGDNIDSFDWMTYSAGEFCTDDLVHGRKPFYPKAVA